MESQIILTDVCVCVWFRRPFTRGKFGTRKRELCWFLSGVRNQAHVGMERGGNDMKQQTAELSLRTGNLLVRSW